jgi:hypothetical protein
MISAGASAALIDPSLLDMEISIPAKLRPTLEANRHLIGRVVSALQQAIQASFSHPDTRMRNITQQEVKSRVNLCYEALEVMYFEEKLSLIRCCDMLPTVLVDTLRMQYGVGDVTDGVTPDRWGAELGVQEEAMLLPSEPGDDSCNDLNETTE